jgi:acyl-CoA synthetase (NDP forming)
MNIAAKRGIPSFTMPEAAVKAISALTQRSEYLKSLATA